MDSNSDDRDPELPPDVPPNELQEALQWLEELTGPTSVGPAAEAAIDSPFHGLVDDGAGDLPDWLREAPQEPVESRLADEGEFESRLDWLAKMAERESIEELPTLEWRNLNDAPQPPAAGEAAPLTDDTLPPTVPPEQWPVEATPPEPLTAEAVLLVPEAPADEVVPEAPAKEVVPATAPADEAPAAPLPDEEPAIPLPDAAPAVALEATPITPEALLDTLPPDEELPPIDDLDAAMAWIEELAASQDAPIEDVPSVGDRALASKLMIEAGLSPDGLDMRRPGDELALGDLSLLEGNTPVNAFVAAEDFADTIVLVETMAAEQGQPRPPMPDMPMRQAPAEAEVSFEQAMAFLDELAADQEPLGAQTQPLEPVDAAADTASFLADELRPEESLLSESTAEHTPWLADDAEPEAAPATAEDASAVETDEVEPPAEWPAEPEVAWVAAVVTDAAEPEAAWPDEAAATDRVDEPAAGEWLADAVAADVALAPGDAPWLAGSEEGTAVVLEPEVGLFDPSDATPAVEVARTVADNGDILATLEETLRAVDALALPPGQTLAEFDTALQQHGATVTRRDLPAAVEWLELALGISVPTTPPTPQWSDDELISQMPDDPDAVLAWLEQLAEEDTVDSSPQLSTPIETPDAAPGVPAVALAERAAGAAEPLIDELSEADFQNMPEDPDAVMAWLEGLAGGRREPVAAVAAVAPTAPPQPEVPRPPTPTAPEQAAPAPSSRSRRRRGRKGQPPAAPVEAAAEPAATDAPAWNGPVWEVVTDEAAADLIPATLTADAPPVEGFDGPVWETTTDEAAADLIPATLTPDAPLVEAVDGPAWAAETDEAAPEVTIESTAIGEAEADVFLAPWADEALAAPLEVSDEPTAEVDVPPPARPRRRGRPPKVAPVDGAAVAETAGEAVEEVAGTVDAAAEQAVDTAEALPQPPQEQEIENTPPPAKPASWVDLLKPLK